MVLLALAAAACGRFGFSGEQPIDGPEGSDAKTDAPPASACLTWGPWETVRPLDELSSSSVDWSYAWGDGGKQVVFESERNPNGSGNLPSNLYLAVLDETTGIFGAPRALDELNTVRPEASPTLSENGLEIFYTFNAANNTNRIMRATRPSPTDRFGEAVRFADGYGPDLGRGDLDLVYNDPNGRIMIRSRSTPTSTTFGTPTPIDSISSGGWPSLSSDGLELFYETATNQKIATARRVDPNAPFSAPQPLSELEAGADPDISSDGRRLLYVTFEPENRPKLAKRVCLDSN